VEKLSHIWIGCFSDKAPNDYFNEEYNDDDDKPISRFVDEQGEIWVDHDFLEIIWSDNFKTIDELVENLSPKSKGKVILKIKEFNIERGNILIILPINEISTPRSVNNADYNLYYIGQFDNTFDEKPIEEWIKEAEAGNVKSQGILGQLYIFPPPTKYDIIDYDKAEYWLLKASKNGETSTYNRLFHLYFSYSEKHHNLKKAFYWIEKAANIGWRTDQHYCAKMYENGEGVEQNNILAMKWHFLDLCQYDSDTLDHTISDLKAKMSKNEIEEAIRLALKWIDAKKYNPDYFSFRRNPLQ
jgi:Immunity protein 22/Sel1 repeat